jgi:hypothetical protein
MTGITAKVSSDDGTCAEVPAVRVCACFSMRRCS